MKAQEANKVAINAIAERLKEKGIENNKSFSYIIDEIRSAASYGELSIYIDFTEDMFEDETEESTHYILDYLRYILGYDVIITKYNDVINASISWDEIKQVSL